MNNITSFYIAGINYVDQKHLDVLKIGDNLIIEHEPENPYDAKAIKIFSPDGNGIGYVPKNKTVELHNYRLAAVPLKITLANYIPEMPSYKRFLVTVQSDEKLLSLDENVDQFQQFLPYKNEEENKTKTTK